MCAVFWSAAQGGGSPNPPLLSGVFTGEVGVTTLEGGGGGVEKPVLSLLIFRFRAAVTMCVVGIVYHQGVNVL